MKNKVLVDIDTDRKEMSIILSKVLGPPKTLAEAQAYWKEDVVCLCEALCTLIHVGDRQNWQPGAQTLRECIKHLTDGFADASYQITAPMGSQPHPKDNG